MLPSAIEVLPQIPLSRNGKVDRKALAERFQGALAGGRDRQPLREDPLEQKLAAIWRELTLAEDIARDDDFFMIGGTSLTAVGLLNRLSSEGLRVNIDLIFNHSVFHDMVEALKRAEDEEENFRQGIDLEALLTRAMRNLHTAAPEPAAEQVRNIFLTGATGYLGIYVLRALVQSTNCRIHCLLRCRDEDSGYQRLRQMSEEKGLGFDLDRDRVRIIPGDLSAERFGLDEAAYAALAQDMDKVLHIAALISLIAPFPVCTRSTFRARPTSSNWQPPASENPSTTCPPSVSTTGFRTVRTSPYSRGYRAGCPLAQARAHLRTHQVHGRTAIPSGAGTGREGEHLPLRGHHLGQRTAPAFYQRRCLRQVLPDLPERTGLSGLLDPDKHHSGQCRRPVHRDDRSA
ncbi:SDR family oxidoreductase [Pseudomonas aeruginosa]|nr:SDR family oxidoreductase [Pseudomonas aeruginosa]